MNEVIKEDKIKNKIYIIRGVQVILDNELAKIYGCTNGTKDINKAVKRNIEKFPNDFYFQLTKEEFNNLRFQNGTTNMTRTLPHAFTEQGIAMLSSVLKTQNAANASINIIRAFVAMRHFIIDNNDILKNIIIMNNKIETNTNNIAILNQKIDNILANFQHNSKKEYLFMNGEIYDSYSKILDILKEAQKELIIIDGYADKIFLDIIKNLKVKVCLITKTNTLLKKLDIEKYNKQYNNLKIVYSNIFHDRFIITDNKEIYNLGTSLNHAGNKIFSINKLEEKEIKEALIKKIKSIL